jgi:hypothetical protein
VLGLATAAVLFFCGYMAKSAIEDLEWEEANEEANKEGFELQSGEK